MLSSATSAFHFVHRNRTYYLPFIISPQYLPLWLRPCYTIWLCVELLGHLLTVLSIILFVTVAWKSKAFHINMLIINTYAVILLGGTNLLTRLFFIQIELGTLQIGNFIWPVHFLKNCAWLGIYNYVVYATLERYAAFRFATDYETNRRVWVSATLIFVNTIITVPVAFLLIFDLLNGAIYSALVCAMSNVSCLAFSRIKARSVINEQRLANFTNVRQYTVSHRWQIKENIRLAKKFDD
ncbi:hypothetical protein PENTCL1PPCAC_15856 [Pristionchus entomophagus]|uniref:G protein-coupled receptor n=1 Tax=Pristionchus entomophagus TaxID=358040 RepID=A0AAV5THA0_9BILA|nr:hypothetical protein PENTCL1PPCAC_15856 [Pristionchus entomophagus]